MRDISQWARLRGRKLCVNIQGAQEPAKETNIWLTETRRSRGHVRINKQHKSGELSQWDRRAETSAPQQTQKRATLHPKALEMKHQLYQRKCNSVSGLNIAEGQSGHSQVRGRETDVEQGQWEPPKSIAVPTLTYQRSFLGFLLRESACFPCRISTTTLCLSFCNITKLQTS